MTSLNSHGKDLSRFWQGEILWNRSMSDYSTLKVGGPAEAIISVNNTDDISRLVKWLGENDISWRILGRGSNILVPDQGLPGVTLVLDGDFKTIIKEETRQSEKGEVLLVRAGGGCQLSRVLQYCTANSLSGLEFASGIPGSVGGAVAMNAGAWGQEIADIIDSATLMDIHGELSSRQAKDLGFTYRGWGMMPKTVLLDATLAMKSGPREEIRAACRRYQELRRQKQPLAEYSAGSFFKNPPERSAGRLIDEAGLKGYCIGGAKVSEKHANFIINTGNASSADIFSLMRFVQETVLSRFGIQLEPEVHILGDEGQ